MPVLPLSVISVWGNILDNQFEELVRYANSLERLLDKESRTMKDCFKAYAAHLLTEEQLDGFAAWTTHDLAQEFPRILRYSLFVHSYSLLEDSLLRIADFYKRKSHLELSPSDLKDEGMMRAKTYLKKVVHIPFPDTHPSWQTVSTLNHIRNLIVHKTGYFPQDNRHQMEINAFISRSGEAISLDSQRHFVLSSRFTELVIETFRSFSKELFANLKEPTSL
jgi:hypothetical protein